MVMGDAKKPGRSFWDDLKTSAKKPFETWKKKPKKPNPDEQGGASSTSGTVASGVTRFSGFSQQAHHDQGPKQGRARTSASGGVAGALGGSKQIHYDKGNTSDLTSPQEKTNYSRLCCLLISVGSRVLRDTFDRIIPPQNLQSILKRDPAHSKLQSRRKEGILNSMQWCKLYPATPSEVSSAGFDPALLIVLLRTICNLSPPPAGWDTPPLTADTSRESDIVRVKYFMNVVSKHDGVGFVRDAVFSNYWQQIRDTLMRLGGADYKDAIDEIMHQEMEPLDEEHFQELLKQWKKVEENIKDKLNELESVEASKSEGPKQGGARTSASGGVAGASGESKQVHYDKAQSIFSNLQKMQCDTDKVNNKINLPVDLRKIASDKGFTISDNPASGNCMFYALSEQLQSVKGIQISHTKLRETLVQFIKDNPYLHDGTPLFNFVSGYPSWHEYLQSMVKDSTWGDHLVLHAAANYFRSGIRIISSLGSDIPISPEIPVANISPLVLGHVHELHYVSLQPSRSTCEDPEQGGVNSTRCGETSGNGSLRASMQAHHVQGPEQGGASSTSGTVASGVTECSGASQQAHHDQGPKQGGARTSASGGVAGASGGSKPDDYDKGPKQGGARTSASGGVAGASGGSKQVHYDKGNTSDLTSPQEKTNYSRLCRLLISVGSRVLRDTFDSIIPPQNLQSILKRHPAHSKLQSRRKEGILNSMQWSKLYPTKTSVSSTNFNPALLIVLLRTICNLSPPPAGWDTPPLTADTSRESDIVRVKYFMNVVSKHDGEGSVSDAVFSNYWQQIRDTLMRLGGADYEDAIDEMKNQEMDCLEEEHFQELLKQWKKVEDNIKDKLNELESVEPSEEEDVHDVIEKIRQMYRTREERVQPLPWCEDCCFHLNDIFTRLKIVGKEKIRGALTDEITNMSAIFKVHVNCQNPRTVLIEGEPGMGKTTYCQKLAYDWATKQEEWDASFPETEVLLLLTCHDITSDIWKAIEEQILPVDIDEEAKESFFKFIRKNQSKVTLVLDGLDEAKPGKLAMYFNLLESRELTGCHIVLTSRHETGMKVRKYCDNLWEIVGFTSKDAQRYIHKYFKTMEDLATKLIVRIWGYSWFASSISEELIQNHEPDESDESYESCEPDVYYILEELTNNHEPDETDESEEPDVYYGLEELTQNPLNTALLCVVWEDFKGVFPTSRTQLYIEIVHCVLRRYEKKYALSSKHEDLISVYKDKLKHLGRMALQALRKGELYFEEHELDGNSIVLSKFGFLSIDASSSKRKPSSRYRFLHKSFQELFAGLYLAFQILDGEIDCDSVVTDQIYSNELNQVFIFMSGILASQSEEAAVSLVKSFAVNVNLISRASDGDVIKHLGFALRCISECRTNEGYICSRLLHTLGVHLDVKTLNVEYKMGNIVLFFDALVANSSLTSLDLSYNRIGPSGAASLSQALAAKSSHITNLNLSYNGIGDSGAAFLSQALAANSSLTNMDLSRNMIGPFGVYSLSQVLAANSFLTTLDLSYNKFGPSGAASLSQAFAANSSLTNLNLSYNGIGCSGATSLSQALAANSSLTNLDLSQNGIGPSGADSLSQALAANSSLTTLDLSYNKFGSSGAASLSQALAANSSLTNLNLRRTGIGSSGATSLSQAFAANSSLTNLDLNQNGIGPSGADSLSQALAANSSLTTLDLSYNEIGDSGASSLFQALLANSSLTILCLSYNKIGPSGAASLSQALAANSSLFDYEQDWFFQLCCS